jgi:hypothetical protein
MKTFLTIVSGILLALSCVATSDARLHPNREGQTQSEPSNYNPDQDSQTSTRNLDNSCLHCGETLPSYESNGFPITPLQALVVSPKGMQERLSPIQMAQKPLPSYESKGFQITALEVVLFGPNDVKERAPLVEGSMGG